MSSNKDRREHAPQHFNTLARSLHWLMAVMILAMLFIGAAMMTSLHHRIWLIELHRPLGIAILLLALVRLVNRLLSRTPPLPADLPVWQVLAAKASHWMLYGLMLAMPLLGWALPVGISFYTFQILSYVADVYRGDVKAQRNFIDLAAYIAMFPQLIAGPIVKYRDVSDQLHVYKHRYNLKQIEEGMTLFTFGLAKKVLLADAVGALWTDIIGVADSPSTTFVGLANASTPLVWLGIIAYSLQLYFDFSGYSLMGIGMGKMLGFDFPANFNYPYISASITEFWRRWHMTLSGWFREYVYIPLGGNRKGLKRQILNLFIVELLTGIWHGANWNFICWGLYYFVLLAAEKLFLLPYLKKGKVWPHFYTLFLVVVGWAMFVGNDTGVSFGLLFQKLFIPSGGVSPLYFLRNYGVLLAVSVVCCTPLIEKLWDVLRKNVVTRCAAILTLLVVSTAYVVGSTNSPFLYFNF